MLLHALWWLFSKWYRRVGTPERTERYISGIADREGVTTAQAVAMVWAEIPEPMRPALSQYRAATSR